MTETPWEDVQVSDVVRGRDGSDWEVTGRSGMTFVLEREGRNPIVKTMTGNVVLTSRGIDQMNEARAVVGNALGGVALAVEIEGEPPACPVDYDEPGPLLSHLYVLHGVRFDGTAPESTLSELAEMHKVAHDTKGHGYAHHHHTPLYLEANA